MAAQQSVRPGVLETLQSLQTALGNGTAFAVPPNVQQHIFYIQGNGTIGAGAVAIETASAPDYTGTWASLVNDKATPTTNPVVVASSAQVIYTYIGQLSAIRARISTTVTTGTVSVFYKGNCP